MLNENLSGLELMQAMVTGDFPHPSMADVVPIKSSQQNMAKWSLKRWRMIGT